MRKKTFYSLLAPELTSLQKEQIALGKDHDLDEKDIAMYASSRYNFEQMREIRLALEHHVDRRYVRSLCDPSLPAKQMKEMRMDLQHGRFPRTAMKHLEKAAAVMAGGSALFLVLALFVPEHRSTWHLNASEAEILQGERFDPMQYVEGYRKEDGVLVLPENVDTETPGSVLAEYRTVQNGTVTRQYLRVTVKEKSREELSGLR